MTAPGGGPCTGPRPPRREKKAAATEGEAVPESAAPADTTTEQAKKKKKKKKKPSASANGKQKASTKVQGQRWHDILNDEVKESLTAKGIRHATGTVDIAIDKQRIKLGTRGYVSMAHGDAILAEGTFTATEDGIVILTWEHVLKFVDGEWKGATADGIIGTFSMTDGAFLLIFCDLMLFIVRKLQSDNRFTLQAMLLRFSLAKLLVRCGERISQIPKMH